MSANTRLHVCDITRHVDIMMIIAIYCDSLCTNCRFLETGLVDHIGVLQTPVKNYESRMTTKTDVSVISMVTASGNIKQNVVT